MSDKKAKNITVKLMITPGKANPAPPVGSILGQRKIKIQDFCKQFNAETSSMPDDLPVITFVTIYPDLTFSFVVKKPTVSSLIKKKISLKSGSSQPGLNPIASINMSQIREIAQDKMSDMNANDLDMAASMVAGTARSMGVNVIDGQ